MKESTNPNEYITYIKDSKVLKTRMSLRVLRQLFKKDGVKFFKGSIHGFYSLLNNHIPIYEGKLKDGPSYINIECIGLSNSLIHLRGELRTTPFPLRRKVKFFMNKTKSLLYFALRINFSNQR